MVIFTKFLDFVIFGTKDLGHSSAKLKMLYHLDRHHRYPILHAENDLSKLHFNFTHFIGPILTLHGPTAFLNTISTSLIITVQQHFVYTTVTKPTFIH